MKHLILLTALTLAPLVNAEENAPLKDPPREELEKLGGFVPAPLQPEDYNIHVDVQVIGLPIEVALPLIEPLRDPAQIEKTVAKLHEMIAARKATLVGWPMVVTKSGQRAVSESVDEHRYATEFSPTTVPAASPPAPQADPAKPEAKPAAADAPASVKKPEVSTKEIPANAAPLPDGPVTATAFEKRDCGITLEIEPSLDVETMRIDMQLAPQHVSFIQFDKITTMAAGKECTVEQPLFHANKVSTNLTVRSGQSILLGTFQAGKPDGWMELFILKATANKTK